MAAVGEGVVSEVSVLFALYGVNSLHEAVVGGVDQWSRLSRSSVSWAGERVPRLPQ